MKTRSHTNISHPTNNVPITVNHGIQRNTQPLSTRRFSTAGLPRGRCHYLPICTKRNPAKYQSGIRRTLFPHGFNATPARRSSYLQRSRSRRRLPPSAPPFTAANTLRHLAPFSQRLGERAGDEGETSANKNGIRRNLPSPSHPILLSCKSMSIYVNNVVRISVLCGQSPPEFPEGVPLLGVEQWFSAIGRRPVKPA